MDHKNYNWGLVWGREQEYLYKSLLEVIERFPSGIVIVEVGCRELFTGLALTQICKDNNANFAYYGIDTVKYRDIGDLPDVHQIIADANDPKVLNLLPPEFHFVFIDACHCEDCVENQGKMYSSRLVKGGIIAFHDAGDEFQNHVGDGHAETHNRTKLPVGVRKGLDRLDLVSNGYEVLYEERKGNGIIVYRKCGGI